MEYTRNKIRTEGLQQLLLDALENTDKNHELLTADGRILCFFYGCDSVGCKKGFTNAAYYHRMWCEQHYQEMKRIHRKKKMVKKSGSSMDSIKMRMEELLKSKIPDVSHMQRLGLEIRAMRNDEHVQFRDNNDIIFSGECRAYGCLVKMEYLQHGDCFCDEHQAIHKQIMDKYKMITDHEERINLLLEEIAFYKTTAAFRVVELLEVIHEKHRIDHGWIYKFD